MSMQIQKEKEISKFIVNIMTFVSLRLNRKWTKYELK